MTVFEMIQKEEEYKTFTRLFLITDPLIYIITPPPQFLMGEAHSS